jgi:hypothetical protein
MFEKVNKKALASFIIFCVVLTKDVLVNDLKLIPVRSPANRLVSWFIILPITIIGIIFSIQFFKIKYFKNNKAKDRQFAVNVFLAIPILLYAIYVLLIG